MAISKKEFNKRIEAHNKQLLASIIKEEECTLEDLIEDGYIELEYYDGVDEWDLFDDDKIGSIIDIRDYIPENKIKYWDAEVLSESLQIGECDLASMARCATRDALRDYMQDKFVKDLLDKRQLTK